MNEQSKLEKMVENYGNPYAQTQFPKDSSIKYILDNFIEERKVSLAGRLITKRQHGKSSFAHIGDASGKIQLYAKSDILKQGYELFKELDIGDIIGVSGSLFKTRTQEPTLLAKEIKLLAKSLKVLPEKWHGLKDKETRYRQRYLDLIANPAVREVFYKRSFIVNYIRSFFNRYGYIEVDTPILHTIPGGASGSPFITHHNALDLDVYLRIAPELYLKRLLVGGFDKVYEINKSFRNEGISVRHSPEFTMLEAYCAYENYEYMMKMCEELISSLVKEFVSDSLILEYGEKKINFKPPWPRVSFADLFKKEFAIEADDPQEVVLKKVCEKLNLSTNELSRTQILNITEELIEKHYPGDKPSFVVDFFSWTAPLAKAKRNNPHILERFELFIAGMEVANSYSELNDPIEQRKRLNLQLKNDDELPKKIDEDFLTSLEYGMPPAAGLGIGIDRLVMLILNQPSIRDVIFFPLLKPIDNED
jgi:lysyl-tRNA synthetase class 2